MADITCKNCGEPWSIYHLRHERDGDEYERVMSGEGCPACNWGEEEGEDIWGPSNEQEHFRTIMQNTDDDPLKFL